MGSNRILTKDERVVEDDNPFPVKVINGGGGIASVIKLEGDTSTNIAEVDSNNNQLTVIRDGTNQLKVEVDGSINVNGGASGGNTKIEGDASGNVAEVTAENELLTVNRQQILKDLDDGNIFYLSDFFTLNNGVVLDIALNTPATGDFYLLMEVTASDNFSLEFYEGSTLSGGFPFVLNNRNRASSNTQTITSILIPTVTAAGTNIAGFSTTPSGSNKLGGSVEGAPIRLNNSEVYLLRLSSFANGNTVNIGLNVVDK